MTQDDVYKVMVKVQNEDPYRPPTRHLDTLELPKEKINPIKTEKELVSLLYLVYKSEMKVTLQVSRGGFKTVYQGLIEPFTQKTRKGKQLKFLKFQQIEEKLEYYLGIEPSTWRKGEDFKKITSPYQLVPSNFVKQKQRELEDYSDNSILHLNEKNRL